MALSYWERNTLQHYDLIVVGSGLVGLSTAYHYATSFPNKTVVVIERGLFPTGASTKNAGFACFGSLSELKDTASTIGYDGMIELVEQRYKGGLELRALLGDDAIDYRPVGGMELGFEAMSSADIASMNEQLQPLFKEPVFLEQNERISEFGFSEAVVSLTKNNFEGTIDTGKMMQTFMRRCSQAGVAFLTQTEVLEVVPGEQPKVEVNVGDDRVALHAQQIALCTNAFTQRFVPETDVRPGRGLVLVSKPIKNWHLEGSFHYHSGYNYFRTIGGRLLLGGGRCLDLDGEQTFEFGTNPTIYNALVKDMHTLIAPGKNLEVDYHWSGIMAFGATKQPKLKCVDQGVYAAFGMGGMGVAIGCGMGRELAEMMAEENA